MKDINLREYLRAEMEDFDMFHSDANDLERIEAKLGSLIYYLINKEEVKTN